MSVDRSFILEGGPVGVLLIHGLGGTPVEMRDVARRLAATGATVSCCQLAGHCGTEDELAATRFEDWYESAATAFEALAARCGRVIVGGLSMGAVLAALLAAREPERVRGLVMLSPTLRYDGWSIPRYSFLLRLLIDTPLGRRYRFVESEPYGIKDERLRARLASAMKAGNPDAGALGTPSAALRQFWRLVDTVKPVLGSIRQPAFIAHPRHDDVASLKNAVYLQRHLGGPVECLVLDDSYHLVTVDRQRHLVTDRVTAFVNALAASERRVAAPATSTADAPLSTSSVVAHVA